MQREWKSSPKFSACLPVCPSVRRSSGTAAWGERLRWVMMKRVWQVLSDANCFPSACTTANIWGSGLSGASHSEGSGEMALGSQAAAPRRRIKMWGAPQRVTGVLLWVRMSCLTWKELPRRKVRCWGLLVPAVWCEGQALVRLRAPIFIFFFQDSLTLLSLSHQQNKYFFFLNCDVYQTFHVTLFITLLYIWQVFTANNFSFIHKNLFCPKQFQCISVDSLSHVCIFSL